MTDRAPEAWLSDAPEADSETDDGGSRGVGAGAHTVRQGETVYSIAARHKVRWQDVWDHPANEALRRVRKEPGVLLPGDRLTVPPAESASFEIATGRVHSFRAPQSLVPLSLKVLENNAPRRGKAFELNAGGLRITGVLDDEGALHVRVPADALEATLTIRDDDAGDDELHLTIGGLDPLETVSGVQGRLRNLGYDVGEARGELDSRTRVALRSFQVSCGLDPTGRIDEQTRRELRAKHGS